MTEEFKYWPPIKYLFVGLGGLVLFFIFGLAVIKGAEIWFSIIVGTFSLMGLGIGIGFLTIFFRKFNVGKLKIGTDFIEIPGRWKNRIKLNFNDILEIGEFDTYDNVIEIESRQGIHFDWKELDATKGVWFSKEKTPGLLDKKIKKLV